MRGPFGMARHLGPTVGLTAAAAWDVRSGQHDSSAEPGYRFWFLLRDGEPVVAFETNGTARWPSGWQVDLFERTSAHAGDLAEVIRTEVSPRVEG